MPFQLSMFHLSAIALLLLSSAILNHGRVTSQPEVCVSHDQPNPLADLFPNNATGVLNATLLIIPIALETARRLIPPQYGILERAYRDLLPDFPAGMYPVLMQAAHDHDVQFKAYGITIDDFSRVGFEFPFLDLLNDGHSSFRWAPSQLITATHDIALQGSRDYGTVVSPATWDPPCDAYRALPNGNTFFRGQSTTSPTEFIELETTTRHRLAAAANPYPLELFKNITNQPTFANASSCDNMIRWFNTTMSAGTAVVQGRVRARNAFPYLGGEERAWDGVWGVQVATPFIENNYLSCGSMRGYRGTGGAGDSFVESESRGGEL
ncbi:hypothetical protein B0T18DRAFT_312519 [Schizothecium vesticola]|uniref:Uncharacterized protein n=1 Tax=Schizothecium vesticola TaxID=314040 RepID=A0AA40KCT1_9PEZI|nr:hypothetical protein B0T18DRAFT_312519 [Schizothecium vesticola]